jgi:hypothetical protein
VKQRLNPQETLRQGVNRIAVPINRLNDSGIAKALMVMAAGDGAIVLSWMKPGHIAILVAEETARKMVAFSSRDEMLAFAKRYGLATQESLS